jgi:hypothetical protein
MSKTPPDGESSRGSRELSPETRPESGEAWDPLASVRKTISPTQRIQLLKMQVPVLPPEDFMDTAEFERGRAARSRRFLPLVYGLGGALLILLFAGLWSRFWSAHSSVEQTARSHLAQIEKPRPAALTLNPSAEPHQLTPSSPPVQPPARAEPPIQAKLPAPTDPKPAKAPRSTATHTAPPQATTSTAPTPTAPTPEPAPSGIKFWTQPR